MKKALQAKARDIPMETLFPGQAVYYWDPPTGITPGRRNPPRLIGGVHDSQVLIIAGPNKFITVRTPEIIYIAFSFFGFYLNSL